MIVVSTHGHGHSGVDVDMLDILIQESACYYTIN